jgi:hypothetical protein
MLNIDWATAKGIADEATLDRFVALHGGIRVSELIGNVQFENADYLFPHENVIAELKILETEFANTSAFKLKLDAMLEQFAKEKRTIGGPFVGKPYSQEFIRSFVLLFKPIFARIAKKKLIGKFVQQKNIYICRMRVAYYTLIDGLSITLIIISISLGVNTPI